jgi:DNA-binding NtrC family response regulator
MIKADKLRGIIAENRMHQTDVSEALGISTKTFYLKMKKGVFSSDEIEKMIDLLHIDNPADIFFAKK